MGGGQLAIVLCALLAELLGRLLGTVQGGFAEAAGVVIEAIVFPDFAGGAGEGLIGTEVTEHAPEEAGRLAILESQVLGERAVAAFG